MWYSDINGNRSVGSQVIYLRGTIKFSLNCLSGLLSVRWRLTPHLPPAILSTILILLQINTRVLRGSMASIIRHNSWCIRGRSVLSEFGFNERGIMFRWGAGYEWLYYFLLELLFHTLNGRFVSFINKCTHFWGIICNLALHLFPHSVYSPLSLSLPPSVFYCLSLVPSVLMCSISTSLTLF